MNMRKAYEESKQKWIAIRDEYHDRLVAAGLQPLDDKNYTSAFPIGRLYVKKRRKFANFTIKKRQSLPVVNHHLIVFITFAVFLDWKNGAKYWKN